MRLNRKKEFQEGNNECPPLSADKRRYSPDRHEGNGEKRQVLIESVLAIGLLQRAFSLTPCGFASVIGGKADIKIGADNVRS